MTDAREPRRERRGWTRTRRLVVVLLAVGLIGSVALAIQTQQIVEASEVVLVDPDSGARLTLRIGRSHTGGPTLIVVLPNGEEHDLVTPRPRMHPLGR